MGRACTICIHPNRKEIDRRILQGEVWAELARDCEVSRRAIARHAKEHLSEQLRTATNQEGLTCVDQLNMTRREIAALMEEARTSGDMRMRMYMIDRCLKQVALEAKLFGDEPMEIDIASHPRWLAVRKVIMEQLEPYPEIRQALADALAEVDV